jgi:hypothetical protein
MRLQDVQEQLKVRHRALADLNAKVRAFLDRLPVNVELADAHFKHSLKLKEGHTRHQVVADLRDRIEDLNAEFNAATYALPTKDEMKQMVLDHVRKLAAQGTPRLSIEYDKFILQFDNESFGNPPTIADILAWVHPEQMVKRLVTLIDDLPQAQTYMSKEDRETRLAEVKAALFEAEWLECVHIEAARNAGVIIEHRANVDPQALIGLIVRRKNASAAA